MEADAALTYDRILGGRVPLWQQKAGFRVGVDAVLLAAAVPAKAGETVLDVGCGVGSAALCLAARVPGLTLTGVEVQADYAGLARRNAAENSAAMDVLCADIAEPPEALRQQSFDHVLTNPPYFAPGTRVAATDAAREGALAETLPLADWMTACLRRLRPGGTLTVIQKALRTRDLLAACDARVGRTVAKPIVPRVGRDADLVIVQATKGARSPFRLASPLVMHDGDRHISDSVDYSDQARAILEAAEPLVL
ncbi:MAG: methyltransferase [Pseudomonadota bacterium]